MSDNIEVLLRQYQEDVLSRNPRSIGLFPIPEYPELECERGMWSAVLDTVLTTLRFLAPATLLTLFWGQQSFFFTLIRHIDNAFRAIVFSSEEQKKEVLQWLAEAGPMTVEHLDTVWRHGWILCSVLDSALPGSCAGHPPLRLSLQHAQTIADHYLGVEPVFSRHELESNDSLSRHQEWKLATYLDRIRQALAKLTPAVSKPPSQRTSPEATQFTFDYVAKGSGLTVAQIKHKMSFKIYPTSQQALDPGEVTILIKGPKDTYGMTVLPPILGKAQKIRQKLLGLQSKQTYTENVLPITQGATYLRAYGKNDMNKTYFIPKTKYDIEIDVDRRPDHAKIWYTVTREGKYEISITSRGQSIVGSPFSITATHNIIGVLEKENLCLEDGEEIDIVDVKTDRKVVLRIVDFVTEKMLLRENGTLEKISDAEANILMATDVETERSCSVTEIDDHYKSNKFSNVAHKILKMNRVCKLFNEVVQKKSTPPSKNIKEKDKQITNKTQHDIPDIVNSTLYDTGINPFIVPEDKFIVPESISVSIRTEKAKPFYSQEINSLKRMKHELNRSTSPDSLEEKLSATEDNESSYEDNESVDRLTPLRNKNPFLLENTEDFAVEKNLGTFVKSEYEANNSQGEETSDSMIKIIVDNDNSPTSDKETNPFVDSSDVHLLDRPKTPVYKIITGELSDRIDSPYLDPKMALSGGLLGNEFVNPFFTHQFQSSSHYENQPIADFIIGAPVFTSQSMRSHTPEPNDLPKIDKTQTFQEESKHIIEDEICASVFSTPIHTKTNKPNEQLILLSSTFHSLDSDLTDTIDISNASTTSETQFDVNMIESSQNNRDSSSPRKDLWDSAYVSIDESTGSPDGNNNESNIIIEAYNKQKFLQSEDTYDLRDEDFLNMGPAERELWTTCTVLNESNKNQDDIKPYRWEIKRPIFTPIIEESDRSISSGIKDMSLKSTDADSVTVAFAELNDIYQEYFPTSEKRSSLSSENSLQKSLDEETKEADIGVESASVATDVMGHNKGQEGKISEVQANVTESVSVSRTLQNKVNKKPHLIQMQFGDEPYSNIVLEKKKYWDDKIRQIEAKTEESSKHLKKKRVPAKQLKHDSLSKRKGKKIIKNYLNAEAQEAKFTRKNSLNDTTTSDELPVEEIQLKAEAKLVDKWKKFWDEKLESEETRTTSRNSTSKSPINFTDEIEEKFKDFRQSSGPKQSVIAKLAKREIPEEEVFKAFETSPKRFFGTSRKCIMNKIDTFLGKPTNSLEDTVIEQEKVSPDSGLVSSRISLFHKMSNTEPLSDSKRSLSYHNITLRKDSETGNNLQATIDVNEKSQTDNDKTKNIVTEITTVGQNNTSIIKDKRARMSQRSFNISFDDTDNTTSKIIPLTTGKSSTISAEEITPSLIQQSKKSPVPLRKSTISKSEMDIFNKIPLEIDDGLNKHQSYEELPKINVKNFISLYENVSMTSGGKKPVKKLKSVDSYTSHSISINKDAEMKPHTKHNKLSTKSLSLSVAPDTTTFSDTDKRSERRPAEHTSVESFVKKSDQELLSKKETRPKLSTYVSLSDLELEIVESSPDISKGSSESSPKKEGLPHIEYKNRFKEAKQYFQSLEELREIKKPKKLNECQLLLLNKSTESLENEQPQKRARKKKVKSHSMPSSELAKYWNEMQEQEKQKETKLVKISEKFHVDDLFSDVMEGKLSRQGSLRGIPHKKAVLEAFRSMENVSDDQISAYDMSTSHNTEFTIEKRVSSAQTYLNEYPYLPMTDPSKSHSRLDTKASGLITLKELLQKKQRRNSVPDLRLLPKFSAEL